MEAGMKPEKVDRFLAKRKEKEAQKNIDVDEQEPNRSPSSEADSHQGSAGYVNLREESTEQILYEKSLREQVKITQERYIKDEEDQQINGFNDKDKMSKQQNAYPPLKQQISQMSPFK